MRAPHGLLRLLVLRGGLRSAALRVGGAELESFWTPKLERARSGQASSTSCEGGRADQRHRRRRARGRRFRGLKLKPSAIEQVKAYDYKQELKRENTCNAPSVASFMASAVSDGGLSRREAHRPQDGVFSTSIA